MDFEVEFDPTDLSILEKAFQGLSRVDYLKIADKNITQIFNRAARKPGTPIDKGQLRNSRRKRLSRASASSTSWRREFGYTASYAPHVEFGHRTRSGGYVRGQRYLYNNQLKQRPIYRRDILEGLAKAMKK
ncbi:hypothetical protein HMPREF2626_01600 [Aerococcus sp. HMSC062A02]|uniref:HK97 gp10 family phage protein n=1 Tax=Aerococcus sp. HMSC062A02 TaxID=1715105 RepID=UPI0008A37419|nr:HK97 gp10 family phage protein [Aerococcus sp. HMSC062A02]OFN02632.1 hypothetical protein HMPREF2626_01600 [Aerococcus sp. HMSC062A02]